MFEDGGNRPEKIFQRDGQNFADKLKAMRKKISDSFLPGQTEQPKYTLPNLAGLKNLNFIDEGKRQENKAEQWLEKRLKVAEEEAKLTSVFTGLAKSEDYNWIILNRNSTEIEINPEDLFKKYFPCINQDRKNLIIELIDYAMYKVEESSVSKFKELCETLNKVKIEKEVTMIKLPLLTIFRLEDDDFNKLFGDKSVAVMVVDRYFMVARNSYGNDLEVIQHEYQHFVYSLLTSWEVKNKSELRARFSQDNNGDDTTASKDIDDTFKFKNEILAYMVDGSTQMEIMHYAESFKNYNYRESDYESKLLRQDEILKLEPELIQSALDHNSNLTQEYNTVADRTNYLVEINKLIEIAFQVRTLIESKYSQQKSLPNTNLIFTDNFKFDDYEISLITTSILRDTSTENWYKLVDLLKSLGNE